MAYGLVAPLFEQGQGGGQPSGGVRHWALPGLAHVHQAQVTGIDLFSAGDFMGGAGTEEIVMSDPGAGLYKSWCSGRQARGRLPVRQHRGRELVLQAAARRPPVSDLRDKLMFGENQHRRQRPAARTRPPICPTTPRSAAATA